MMSTTFVTVKNKKKRKNSKNDLKEIWRNALKLKLNGKKLAPPHCRCLLQKFNLIFNASAN